MHWPVSPELALSFLIGCTVKATFVLGLTAVAARAIRNGSAAMRHYAWALGIACSMGLPLLTLLLPSWHSVTLGNAAGFLSAAHAGRGNVNLPKLPSTVIDAAAGSLLSGRLLGLALLLWALGTLFVAMKLFVGLARLTWVSTRSASAVAIVEDGWAHIV